MSLGQFDTPRIPAKEAPSKPGTPLPPVRAGNVPEFIRRGSSFISAEGYTWLIAGSDATNIITSVEGEARCAAVGALGNEEGWAFVTGVGDRVRMIDGEGDVFCLECEGLFEEVDELWMGGGKVWLRGTTCRGERACWVAENGLERSRVVEQLRGEKVVTVCGEFDLLVSEKKGRVRVWKYRKMEQQFAAADVEERAAVDVAVVWEMDNVGEVGKAFPVHDETGQCCLAIVANGTVWGLRLEQEEAEVSNSVAQSFLVEGVLDALALKATRAFSEALDLLVLSYSNDLLLYQGAHLVASIFYHSPDCGLSGLAAVDESHFTLLQREMTLNFTDCSEAEALETSYLTLSLNLICDRFVERCKETVECYLASRESNTNAAAVYCRDLIKFARRDTKNRAAFLDWPSFEAFTIKTAHVWSGISRQTQSSIVNDSTWENAWSFLLRTEKCSTGSTPCCMGQANVSDVTVKQFPNTFLALHLLHEELCLNTVMQERRFQLALLMMRICAEAQKSQALEYYIRDYGPRDCFGERLEQSFRREAASKGQAGDKLPDIFEELACVIDGASAQSYPSIFPQRSSPNFIPKNSSVRWRRNSPLPATEAVLELFILLYSETASVRSEQEICTELLQAMTRLEFGFEELNQLPWSVALPIHNALTICRFHVRDDWKDMALILTEREDMMHRMETKSDNHLTWRVHARQSFLQIRAAAAPPLVPDEEIRKIGAEGVEGGDRHDECAMPDPIHSLRFNRDRRLQEVKRLLISSRAVCMRLSTGEMGQDGSADDREADQQVWLEKLLKRHLALSVGRGAFTLHTLAPSDPTKPLHVPELVLRGKLPGPKSSVKIQLDANSTLYDGVWPIFHNGVAAGLRLVNSSESKDFGILTRSWIVKHKPRRESITPEHAGILLGLGLGGYLPVLRMTDYYEYLLPKHDLTSIALMLGVPAGMRATKDPKILKMCCLHIPYFVSDTFMVPEYQFSTDVQSAALVGLGLLYQGSSDHYVTEALLCELTRLPAPGNNASSRESTSLSAGLAIGLVGLGMGSDSPALKDLRLLDTLSLFIQGGKKSSVALSEYQQFLDKKMPNDLHESNASKQDGQDPIASHGQQDEAAAESQPNLTRETDSINVDITGPGATLALSLMYLGTKDKNAASRLVLPDSHYTLAQIRPHHVLLRAMAKVLILARGFSSLKAALEIVPPLIRPVIYSEELDLELLESPPILKRGEFDTNEEIDWEGILEARVCAVTGLALGLALQHAGTGDRKLLSALAKVTRAVEKLATTPKDHVEGMDGRGGLFSSCLENCAICLGVVGAGMGNLREMRNIRRLLRRLGTRRGYGGGMATSMALGFLFLGGGTLTFRNGKEAIACLLCALYPIWPEDVNDNRYHLQALRHLYVLAIESRCVEPRDVDTDHVCSVKLQITMKNGDRFTEMAPTILPPRSTIASVRVVGDRYWEREVGLSNHGDDMESFSPSERHIVYVKRRPNKLSHDDEPRGSGGALASSSGSGEFVEEIGYLAQACSGDPKVLAFTQHILANEVDPSKILLHSSILSNCLVRGDSEALLYHLAGERSVYMIGTKECQGGDTGRNLLLARAYAFGKTFPFRTRSDLHGVTSDHLATLDIRVRKRMQKLGVGRLLRRFLTFGKWPEDDGECILLGRFLRMARIPVGFRLHLNSEGVNNVKNVWKALRESREVCRIPRRELSLLVAALCET